MNEKVYQLMRQAQLVAYAKASAKKKTNSPQNNTVWNEFPEVFAELIVRECVEQIYPQWIKDHGNIEPTNLADAVMRVKEHFGVEE